MSTLLGLVALLIVAGAIALWFRAAMAVRLPRDRRGYLAAWLVGAGLGAAALSGSPGWIGGVPAALALFGGAFLCFTVSISAQKLAPEAIGVGAALPDFQASDENGEPVELASLRGAPLLLKFFRGHW